LKRKLLILNLVLIAAATYAGIRVRGNWRAAKEREDAILSRRVAPAASPQLAALPTVPPVLPVDYADIAQKMLLDKSRNSTVVIETPPAPPPVPVPPLPFYHGQMRLPGEGPIVILSAAAGAAHQAIHPGEMIGPFKLVDATRQELVFEWGDKIIHKNLDDLVDRSAPAAAPAAPAVSAKAAAPPPPPPTAKTPLGPTNSELSPGVKACLPNDSYEDGAVVDGYRKAVMRTPFGAACVWNQVK
jgi:hypothetical protein